MSIIQRERAYYNKLWRLTKPHTIEGRITIPGVNSLCQKRVLICSCGAGYQPVQAANEGAEVFTFDISELAIEKAFEMAAFNEVSINAEVMDFHELKYPADYFDVIYGTMILHHVDCSIVSKELYRCLKPNGIAFFKENSDRNPLLRFFRRTLFGKPGETQKHKSLFFKRGGTADEYPLTDKEIEEFRKAFGKENVRIYFPNFVFIQTLNTFGFKKASIGKITKYFDMFILAIFPFFKKYSFLQEVWMKKVTH